MGFFSPLKSLVGGINKVKGKIDKAVGGVVKKLPGGNTINKVITKLPTPGGNVPRVRAAINPRLPPTPGETGRKPSILAGGGNGVLGA